MAACRRPASVSGTSVKLVCFIVALHSVSPWRARKRAIGLQAYPRSTPVARSSYRRGVTGAEDGALTRDERKYRNRLWFHAALSLAFLISYTTRGTTELGYIPNSVGKDALFVVISVIAALHVRRHGWLVIVIALGYAGLILGQLITLLAWRSSLPQQDILGLFELSPTIVLLGWATVDVLLTAWLLGWWFRAERARHELKYLHPLAFLSLASLAEVLIKGEKEALSPLQIAHNVDGYLSRLKARTKWRIQLALAALFPFRALQPPARERALESIFVIAAGRRRLPGFLRRIVQAAIRVASQMAYLGYYGDKRSWDSIEFKPYSKRSHRPQTAPIHIGPKLRSLAAPPRRPDYDAVVVGSGAAGGLLAYRWAEAGKKVLVLERGPHVDPRELRRGRGRAVPQALQRGRAPARHRLPPQPAAGHVRRRRDDRQQRALPRPAGRGAAAVGAARGRPRRPARRDRAGAHADGHPPAAAERGQRGVAPLRRRRRAAARPHRADAREHPRHLPRLRLLQHRLPVRRQGLGARRRCSRARSRTASRSTCCRTSRSRA